MRRRMATTVAIVLLVAGGVSVALLIIGRGRLDDGRAPMARAADTAPRPASCLGPDVTFPTGRSVDVSTGRAPSPVGLIPPVRAVTVLDLGASAEAGTLAAELAATIEPCPGTAAVAATGSLGELVVAAAIASAERRPLHLSADAAIDGPSDARARSTAGAVADRLAAWGAREVLVVLEDDELAWVALIAEATTGAVPFLVPALEPELAPQRATDTDTAQDGGRADDPMRAGLEQLPEDVRVTVVASEADAAATLSDRVLGAGRAVTETRIIAPGSARAAGGAGGVGGTTLWLVDPTRSLTALVAAAAAGARGDAIIVVDPSDARGVLGVADVIRSAAPEAVLLVGTAPVDAAAVAWHLDVALGTDPLPWGGHLPLDGNRIVALYGTPGVPALGALGQQDLDATIARVREAAEPYAADGLRVVPGFDVIATVASRSPEPQGDYSRRIPIATLRPLIDRAREEGMIVLIDLQPGRTDFLTQAKEYEELLLEPHVSLALDPEWRLGPDEVHLRRIGSVEAAEVQTVVDWLADLVRQERLPQKVLMLHQFTLSMLQDRDTVVMPPELVGVVHVDGQGGLASKEVTYRTMAGDRAEHWAWGWKQFLRIDRPLADPARVIDRDPVPVVVTYQ